MGAAGRPIVVEQLAQPAGGLADGGEVVAGWIEVEDEPVGVVEAAGPGRCGRASGAG